MLKHLFIVALIMSVAVGCSDEGGTEPKETNTLIRMLNGVYDDTTGLDVSVNGTKVILKTMGLRSSGYVKALSSGDSVPVGIHFAGKDSARIRSLQRMYTDGNFTVYAFPPSKTFSVSFTDGLRTPNIGKTRIKVANGVADGGSLALTLSEETNPILGPFRYTGVTSYAELNTGMYAFVLLRTGDSSFGIAFDSVRLDDNRAYTLMLTGTLSVADQWSFLARLFDDSGDGITYQDLTVAPDRGKLQMVHAVPSAPATTVTLDGAAIPTFNNVTFGSHTHYADLTTGAHTATVTANGSAIIADVPFSIVKNQKTTIFVTGSTVPPNIAPLILADLKKPLSLNDASIRVVHLSPDAPNLDGYILTRSGEQKLFECQDLSFRETSFSGTFNSQFFNMYPSIVTMVFKEAGTDRVIAGPTPITLKAGNIRTIWIGGQASSAKIYTVTHN